MSNLPDAHPDTGEPTRIVVGFIAPMAADTMRIGGRAAAYGTGRATVDLANAKDIAGRRCGPAAEAEIGKALEEHVGPRGYGVLVRGTHLCMCSRGVRAQGAEMVTSALGGILKTDEKARHEFLALVAS